MKTRKNFKLINFGLIDSTNNKIKSLLKGNTKLNNLCVSANNQTQGYGRRNSKWFSYKGNIHLSILIKPNCVLTKINQLSFLSAVSFGDIITPKLKNNIIKYKWPNDILLNRKKVGGIIIESSTNLKKKVKWIIIGIGININYFPILEKETIKATSLNKENIFIDKNTLLDQLSNQFFKNYIKWKKDGFKTFKKKWENNLIKKRNKIIIKKDGKFYQGSFSSLSDDGSLNLTINNKEINLCFGNQII